MSDEYEHYEQESDSLSIIIIVISISKQFISTTTTNIINQIKACQP